jgi:hypothetical protein
MHEKMKQKIYILGVVSVIIVFMGTIFKVNHWSGAGYLLIVGILILDLVFIPMALINHFKGEGSRQNLLLHIVTWLTCFVVFTSILFKIQHWSYAGILLLIALPFPYVVFLPIFLITTSKNKNFNIYNTVFVLLLLMLNSVFSALLGLTVSRERIMDSYSLSKNYNKVEVVLDQFPDLNAKSPVCLKINDALKIVNEYKNLILHSEGLSVEEWENAPGNLLRPDSRQAALKALSTTGNSSAGTTELDNSLRNLIREIENTPGYEELAKTIPAILDLEQQEGKEPALKFYYITDNNLVWVLTYLEGIETNLKMIKATATAGI